MIIKATRHATAASVGRVIEHLFRGAENDAVTVLQGSERDLRDAWRDARAHGVTKALRVWILAPAVETSREQAMDAFGRLAGEFAFDLGRAVIVEHDKERTTVGAFDRHWHCAVGEADPVTGRVLSSSHDMPRHEYLARSLEHLFGQPVVLGAHTPSVLARMRREGLSAMADALDAAFRPAADKEPPREAFQTSDHQRAKRKGIDLAEEREITTGVWQAARSFTGLKAALCAEGLTLTAGDRAGEWLLFRDGEQLGSLRRLTKTRKSDFSTRLKELIDADDDRRHPGSGPQLRGEDPGRASHDAVGPGHVDEGSGHPERMRWPAPEAAGERGREHAVGHDAAHAPPDRRDGRVAQEVGGDERSPVRQPHFVRPAGRDPGQLIAGARGVATAVFAFVERAQATARPMPQRVQVVLRRQEGAARADLVPATGRRVVIDIGALRAREKAAQRDVVAMEAEIGAVTGRISDLLADERRRMRSPWLRWLPKRDTSAVLDGLRDHRDALRASLDALAQTRLRAEIAVERAAKDQVRLNAKADQERGAAIKSAQTRLAILSRARTLLARVPALAYVGARCLLRIATRIERAREQGYDPGPSISSP